METSKVGMLWALGLLFASAAQAMPVKYSFTGIGELWDVGIVSFYQSGVNFFGTVTVEVDPTGPSGPDVTGDGVSWVSDKNGWVTADFEIHWIDGSREVVIDPEARVGSRVRLGASVYNDYGPGVDLLAAGEAYSLEEMQHDGDALSILTVFTQSAALVRETPDTSWLSSLGFPVDVGLAPGTGAGNRIDFSDLVEHYNMLYGQLKSHDISGWHGSISLTSFASVPEPAPTGLLVTSLVGIGLIRRRWALTSDGSNLPNAVPHQRR